MNETFRKIFQLFFTHFLNTEMEKRLSHFRRTSFVVVVHA